MHLERKQIIPGLRELLLLLYQYARIVRPASLCTKRLYAIVNIFTERGIENILHVFMVVLCARYTHHDISGAIFDC